MDGDTVQVKVYEAHVRPAGNVLHSIPRTDITERELRVLRSIHGNDCVVGLVQVGTKEVDEREHYMELAYKYGTPRIEHLFGVMLDDFDDWLEMRQEGLARMREARNKEREEKLQSSMQAAYAEAEDRKQEADQGEAQEEQRDPDADEQPVNPQAKPGRRRGELA